MFAKSFMKVYFLLRNQAKQINIIGKHNCTIAFLHSFEIECSENLGEAFL